MAKQDSWIVSLARQIITVYIIVAIVTTSIADAVECPSMCSSCAGGRADCKDRSITAPPKAYPTNTRIIDLQGNHIRILGMRTFHRQPTAEILQLSNNKVAAVRNDAFRTFPRLMTLDLTGNRITRIYVRAFAGLSRLQTLSLSRNRLRRVAGIFRGTVNLHQLNLASNRLAGIQQFDLAPLSRMRYLDLRDNMISRIHQKAFNNLVNLRYLFLNNNPIGSAAGFLRLDPTALQLLDLSNCELTTVPKTMPSTVSEIRMGNNRIMQINHTDFENVTDLQMLTLHDNELHFLADGALTHLTNLKEIWLRGNNLVYVPRDLPANVIRLYMDNNRIQEIEPGLFSNESLLELFSITNNQLRRINPDTFAELTRIKKINVQGNRLQTLEPRTFADLESLESIHLSNNPLQRIEADAFKNLPNLTLLSMSYLQPDTLELDENFLPEMPRLQTFQAMASPGVGQAFVDSVANSPEREFVIMPSVTTVDLSYNNIESISPRLSMMFPNLQSMFLDGNPFWCGQNMSWIQTWLNSPEIAFYQYDELRCENPYSLRGRTIQSLTAREFREGGANTGPLHEGRQRSRRGHGDTGRQDIERERDPAPVSVRPEPTEVSNKEPTHLQLRAQREERRRKIRTRSRSSSRNGKKKGKGKRRRNRKGRKNKRNGGKRDKKNKSRRDSQA